MVVALAAIVVNVRGYDEIADGLKRRRSAALEMRVPGVEANLHAREARLFQKVFQVRGSGHLARRIFNRERNAALAREQGQVFERAERGIPPPLVRNIAWPRHMLNAVAEGNVLDQVQRALDFVHGFLAPHSLRIANLERRAAFPVEMEVARRRRMNGMEREIISREPRRKLVRVLGRAVVKMTARAKQLDRGSPRARRFANQGSRQFPVYKKICGENALHHHNVGALYFGIISTLCEASNRVKASPRRSNGRMETQSGTW